ncbi:MAG: glycosyltransferase family 39 protein [Candidatus Omnitrophica bacterium]|nr:glycosyltransferase family 39 protein [Candidatus Omnitrophota bacterium]
MTIALIAHPLVLSRLFSLDLDSMESTQIRYIQVGFLCTGFLTLFWGFYEVLFRKPGPLILLSILCLIPVVLPFGALGYGSDPDAWAVAFTAIKMHSTGEYLMSRPPGFPLFEYLSRFLTPGAGWPGLLVANLVAGIAGTLVWFLLPLRQNSNRIALLSAATLVHPLYLLGMVTGLDYIWQTLFVSLSLVLLIKGLKEGEDPSVGLILLSGICLGVASGFRITSIAVLPVWIGVLFFAIPRMGQAFKTMTFLAVATVLSTLICELPVLLNFGSRALSVHPDPVQPVIIAYRLLRYVFPIPLLILLVLGIAFIIPKWKDFEFSVRIMTGSAAGVLLIVLPGFFLLPREPGYLTLCVPFVAMLFVFSAPRMMVSVFVPLIAIWGFVSVPIMAPEPSQSIEIRIRPEAGPMVEEAKDRFQNLRRSQQLLLITPKEKTAVVVGFDWATLATLRPEWEIENGVLENPDFPVRYYDWIDPQTLSDLKSEDFDLIVVEGTERFTEKKYGIDLLEEGAIYWDRKKRYFR